MTSLDDILEECLKAIETGRPVESILLRYPDREAELRGLLAAARSARAAGVSEPPASLSGTTRAGVLRRAAELRVSAAASRKPVIAPLLRVAISLALVAILVVTSTRLVSASSGALPGDQLYSVKRSWEDLQLFFVFQIEDHQILESRFTQERLDETNRLLVQGRTAPITFLGLVMHQQDGSWLVSGIRVSITAATVMPGRAIGASDPVMITGMTRADGTVVADEVRLLVPGVALPPLEPSDREAEETGGGAAPTVGSLGTTPSPNAGSIHATQEASYRFSGVVGAMQGAAWIINGQTVYLIDQARVNGTVKVGSIVTFDGYYSSNGRFEVTNVDVNWSPQARSGNGQEGGQGTSSGGSDSGGGEGGSDDGGSGH